MNNQANTENKAAASSASSLVQEITALLATWRKRERNNEADGRGASVLSRCLSKVAKAQRQCADELEPKLRLLTAEYETLQQRLAVAQAVTTTVKDAFLAEAEARAETLQREKAEISEELEANRACNLYTWKERATAAEARAEAAEARLKAAREHRAGCMECQHFRFCREIDPLLSDASPVRDAGEPCTFTGELTPERRCSRGSWGCVTKTHEGDAGEGEQ